MLAQVKEAVGFDGDCLFVGEAVAIGLDVGFEADKGRPGGELEELQIGALVDS